MNIQLKAKQQKGFTIIELVVVILLLGILAATALPRFLDVTDEAHDAVVDGVRGGLQTGVALFRATWVAQGEPLTAAVGGFGDGTLFANSDGYPIGADATLDASTCLEIYNGILQSGRPLAASVTVAFANLGNEEAISDAIDGAAAGTQVAAVTNPGTGDDYTLATSCSYYYIGQFPDAADNGAANPPEIPRLNLNLETGEITETTLEYESAS